jgi:hypothetical protein
MWKCDKTIECLTLIARACLGRVVAVCSPVPLAGYGQAVPVVLQSDGVDAPVVGQGDAANPGVAAVVPRVSYCPQVPPQGPVFMSFFETTILL